MCQALTDLNISHEEFKTTVNKEEKYEQMKEKIRNIKSSNDEDKLSEKSRNVRKIK